MGADQGRRRLGRVRIGVARGRLDDGHLVSGAGRRLHPGQPGRVRRGREHPSLPGRLPLRGDREPGCRPDQDDHPAARRGARDHRRRHLHRALLRLPREARRGLGHRPAAAHLREGPARSGGPRGPAHPRRGTAGAVPRGLPAPGLPAVAAGLPDRAPAARPARTREPSGCTRRARAGWTDPPRRGALPPTACCPPLADRPVRSRPWSPRRPGRSCPPSRTSAGSCPAP